MSDEQAPSTGGSGARSADPVVPDPAAVPISISDAGAVAIGGGVNLTGGVVAGRDLTISHLTLITDDGPPSGDAVARPGHETDVCPYPGIAAFSDRHASFFFGRDRDSAAIIGLLAKADFVAVVGSSGSGKSSLLAAGVVPMLKQGVLPASDRWCIEQLRPGAKPLHQLAARLSGRPCGLTLDQAMEELRSDDAAFGRRARELCDAPGLWVIDQFEEVFDGDVEPAERMQFLSSLVAASASSEGAVRVLLALRSDFYPHLDVHRFLAEAVAANQHRLGPLDRDSIRDVILRPAEEVGLRVEPALVEQILKEVEPSANLLPLLAYALQQTWRRRRNGWLTVAGYLEAGGVSGALEQGAERVWSGLSTAQQEVGRRIFLRLSQVSDAAAPTRRRAFGRDLVTDVDPESTVVSVVESFAAARLLSVDVDERSGEPTVEVTHEALLREWALLRSWLDSDRDARRVQQDLADGAASWAGHARDEAYLIQGVRLRAVEALRSGGGLALNDTEQRFLAASRRLDASQKRRSRLLIALPLGLVLALVFAGVVTIQRRQTERQRVVAQALQLSAESQAVLGDQRDLGLLLSVAALQVDDNPTTRAALLDAETSPDGPLAFAAIPGTRANVIASSFAPDGSVVAGAADGTVRFISPIDGRETSPPRRGHSDALTAVAVSTSGVVASGATNGQVLVHEPDDTDPPSRLTGATSPIRTMVIDRSGGTVAAGSSDGRILRWQRPFVEPPVVVAELPGPIASLALEETTRELVAIAGSGEVRRWQVDSGAALPSLVSDESVRGGPDNKLVVSAGGGLVAIDGARMFHWDLVEGATTSTSADNVGATSVAVTPDGSLTLVGTNDGGVTSWVTTPRPVPVSARRGGLARGVDGLATDGTYVAALDSSGRIVSWYLAGKRSPMGIESARHDGAVVAVAFAPDGTLASVGRTGGIELSGRGADGSPDDVTTIPVTGRATGLAWLRDGMLVVAGDDGSVRQLDSASGAERQVSPPSGRPVVGVATASGNTIGWVDAEGAVVVEGPSGRRQLQVPESPVTAFAMSADGATVAAGAGEGGRSTVTMWSLHDENTTPRRLLGHRLKVTGLAFTPDGKSLASGSDDKTIRLWSVPSGNAGGELLGHTDMVIALAFSPDGTMLASGGEDETVAIWDVASRRQLARMGFGGVVWSLAMAPDGRQVAAGQGSTVVRWPFGLETWVDRACAFANRELSREEWGRYAPTRQPHRLCT